MDTIYQGFAEGNKAVFVDMTSLYDMYMDLGISGLEQIRRFHPKYEGGLPQVALEGYRQLDGVVQAARSIANGRDYQSAEVVQETLARPGMLSTLNAATTKLVNYEQEFTLDPIYRNFSVGDMTLAQALRKVAPISGWLQEWGMVVGDTRVPFTRAGADGVTQKLDITDLDDRKYFVQGLADALVQQYRTPAGMDVLAQQRLSVLQDVRLFRHLDINPFIRH